MAEWRRQWVHFAEAGISVARVPKCACSSLSRMREGKKSTHKDPQRPPGRVAAILRDPRDRLLSLWASNQKLPDLGHAASKLSFCDFARIVLDRVEHIGDDANEHFRRQIWFHDPRPSIWIDFARLASDWLALGLPALVHENSSTHGAWPEYYDDETRARCDAVYARDLALYQEITEWPMSRRLHEI